jgi:ferric-dicitrate binding protein FerR (iron transport regulator)
MAPESLAGIIQKHLQGEALSPEEQLVLDQWTGELQGYLKKRMDKEATEAAYQQFVVKTTPVKVVRIRTWRWVAAAAVIVLLAGGYFLLPRNEVVQRLAIGPVDVQPGRQGAVLTLSDGRRVVLDSLGNGLVATQNGSHVLLEDGQLKYTKGQASTAAIMFNTMTTPKGRQFQLQLPDGTKVWMNAGSTLTYPTAFTGGERTVTVTGEAYFEVVRNAVMPFKVSVNGQSEIEVLGTHFNVKAYANETGIYTTLLEGSVAVKNFHDKIILNPGQQAVASSAPGIDVHAADVDKVMAWKNGLFDFEGATLGEAMNQLSRWYDIEVAYEKGIPKIEFGGKLRRDLTLAGLLRFLEGAGVHFRIEEGRRLIVMP